MSLSPALPLSGFFFFGLWGIKSTRGCSLYSQHEHTDGTPTKYPLDGEREAVKFSEGATGTAAGSGGAVPVSTARPKSQVPPNLAGAST